VKCSSWTTGAALAVLLANATAHAQTTEEPSTDPASHSPPTAAMVRGSPPPGQARGALAEEAPAPTSLGRSAARAFLWLPRGLFLLGSYPPRVAVHVNEKYQLHARAKRVFFNDAGTLGAYPLAFEETGLGLNVGGRMVWRHITRRDEAMRLRASFGGRYEQRYSYHVHSGERLGRLRLALTGELNRRDRELFYGIGNGDIRATPPAPVAVTPGGDAIETRFRQAHAAAHIEAEVALVRRWRLVLDTGLDHHTFSTRNVSLRGAARIDEAFLLDTVTGFQSGVDLATADLELRYDSRRPGQLMPLASVAHGMLFSLFGGYGAGFPEGDWRFVHYGGEAQLAIDLHSDSRVLLLRALLDAVHGGYDDIPMVALPRLGGRLLLRGYDTDRFRDRVAALASAEYTWQVTKRLYAFLFVDAGEVSSVVSDLDPSAARIGYGAGLHLYGAASSLARVQLASSVDGGLFAHLVLDNLLDPLWRKEVP